MLQTDTGCDVNTMIMVNRKMLDAHKKLVENKLQMEVKINIFCHDFAKRVQSVLYFVKHKIYLILLGCSFCDMSPTTKPQSHVSQCSWTRVWS